MSRLSFTKTNRQSSWENGADVELKINVINLADKCSSFFQKYLPHMIFIIFSTRNENETRRIKE